jgi:hypothetical protein
LATWLGSTLAGVLLGKSEMTGTQGGPQTKWALEIVARVAPYVFIVGLLVGLSIVIDMLLPILANIEPDETVPVRQ